MTTQNPCFSLADFDIHLYQVGPDNFTVRYFKQIETDLDYSQACSRLGQAIMHALACDYRIDNRTIEESLDESE